MNLTSSLEHARRQVKACRKNLLWIEQPHLDAQENSLNGDIIPFGVTLCLAPCEGFTFDLAMEFLGWVYFYIDVHV